LVEKFAANLASRFGKSQCEAIMTLCKDPKSLDATPVDKFTDLFVPYQAFFNPKLATRNSNSSEVL